MAAILALRIRQLEDEAGGHAAFLRRTGLAKRTVRLLRQGRGNPTFRTLSAIAHAFDLSVWSLFGIQDETVRQDTKGFGFEWDKLAKLSEGITEREEDEARVGAKSGKR